MDDNLKPGPRANMDLVEELCRRLRHTLAEFKLEWHRQGRGDDLRRLDLLMACHNFYKLTLLDLDREVGERGLFPCLAISTLKQAFKKEG